MTRLCNVVHPSDKDFDRWGDYRDCACSWDGDGGDWCVVVDNDGIAYTRFEPLRELPF